MLLHLSHHDTISPVTQLANPMHLKAVISYLLRQELVLAKNHEESEEKHDDSVTGISEHHGEQERKCNDAEWS